LVERGEAIASVRAHRASSGAAAGLIGNAVGPKVFGHQTRPHGRGAGACTYRSSPLLFAFFLSRAAVSAAFIVFSSAFSSMGGSSFFPLSTWIFKPDNSFLAYLPPNLSGPHSLARM